MNTLISMFNQLKRPKLLIKAARFAAMEFRRERDLKRLLKKASLPRPGKSLSQLLEIEDRLEESRKAGDGSYSITRHVEILAALIFEAGLLKRSQMF